MDDKERIAKVARDALNTKLQKAREELTEEQFSNKILELSLRAAKEDQEGGIMDDVVEFVKGNKVAGMVAFLMVAYKAEIIKAREFRLCIGKIVDAITEDKIIEEG